MWVVDSGDIDRLDDCKREFNEIIFEEVLSDEILNNLETNGNSSPYSL